MTEDVTVRVSIQVVRASGKRASWIKRVNGVDKSKTNGYAFDGEFLNAGKQYDLPLGQLVISKEPRGSARSNEWAGLIGRVVEDGEGTGGGDIEWEDNEWDWSSEFLDFRDTVAARLHPPAKDKREVLLEDLAAVIARKNSLEAQLDELDTAEQEEA